MAYSATGDEIIVTDSVRIGCTTREIEERIDLVRLAMGELAVALVRATAFGQKATVTVPDEITARIFRAALADGAKKKPTHRLINVVVDDV